LKREIRVILADDHAVVREGLGRILEETEDIQVVAQADDGRGAVRLAREKNPDVVVLDFTMPELDGLGATEQIRALMPDVKILILTAHDNIHFAVKVLHAGAHGFLLKEAAPDDLIDAIRNVVEGKVAISPKIMDKLTARFRRGEEAKIGLDDLSAREFELLRHLGSGKSIRESAKSMSISESTASTYRGRILTKLGLKSTADLIRFALENGLVG
jgi:DNA-binding NarL/FixJ family response regulator